MLTRVWLDDYDAGCHGRMGWAVAVSDMIAHRMGPDIVEYLRRHPHTRRLMRCPS